MYLDCVEYGLNGNLIGTPLIVRSPVPSSLDSAIVRGATLETRDRL